MVAAIDATICVALENSLRKGAANRFALKAYILAMERMSLLPTHPVAGLARAASAYTLEAGRCKATRAVIEDRVCTTHQLLISTMIRPPLVTSPKSKIGSKY